MAFTVSDFEDLARLLSEHAEWRTRLRPLILGEEVLALPSRMDRVEAALERLSQDVSELREVTRENGRHIAELREVTAAQGERLGSRMERLDGRMANLEGGRLEARYERNVGSVFAPWVRGAHLLTSAESDALWKALGAASLESSEREAIRRLDLQVRGLDYSTGEAVTLAVEVSHTINVEDVERAAARSSILRRAGIPARAVVGGFRITDAALALAQQQDVIVDLHRPSGS